MIRIVRRVCAINRIAGAETRALDGASATRARMSPGRSAKFAGEQTAASFFETFGTYDASDSSRAPGNSSELLRRT